LEKILHVKQIYPRIL